MANPSHDVQPNYLGEPNWKMNSFSDDFIDVTFFHWARQRLRSIGSVRWLHHDNPLLRECGNRPEYTTDEVNLLHASFLSLFIKQKQLLRHLRLPVNHTREQDAPQSSSYTSLLLSLPLSSCGITFLRVWSPAVLCRWLQLNVYLKGNQTGWSEQSHLLIHYSVESLCLSPSKFYY